MKKILIPVILGVMMSSSFGQCIKPTRKGTILLAATAYAQQYDKMNVLLDKYCYEFRQDDEDTDTPLFVNTSAKGLALIEEKTGKTYANMSVDHNKMDLFSVILIDGAMVSDKVKKETVSDVKKVLSQNYPDVDISKITPEMVSQSRKDLLDKLAQEYSQISSLNRDKMGNTALTYAIATNHPEYLEQSLGGLREKENFIKINKMGVTPLHIAFFTIIKG